MTPTERRELIELWLLAGEGTADDGQLADLSERLQIDGRARACVLDVARQQGWLAWNAGEMQLPAALAALADFNLPPKTLASTPVADSAAYSHLRWIWAAIAASLLSFLAGQWFSAAPESD